MDSINTNSRGFRMLSSLEDLLGRLEVASERKISTGSLPELELISLGFPQPSEATNEHLKQLQPFYVDLLLNIEADKNQHHPENGILSHLDLSDDEAMLLLYVLEFPLLVLMCRRDLIKEETGSKKCRGEAFTIPDIAERIATNKRLLLWCRTAISNQNAHCLSVLSSSVSLLHALKNLEDIPGMISKSKVKKLTKACIFRGEPDEKGFEEFRGDLASVVSRKDVVGADTAQLVANSIMTQTNILSTIYNNDMNRVMAKLTGVQCAKHRETFGKALSGVKNFLEADIYQFLYVMVFGINPSMDLLAIAQANTAMKARQAKRESCDPVFVCDHEGCTKSGTMRCSRCKLVGYCSKECQKVSWKKHKTRCAEPKTTNTNQQQQQQQQAPPKRDDKKIKAAAAAARSATNPALVRQEELLVESPEAIYIIQVPNVIEDYCVCTDDPYGIVMMKSLRKFAAQTSTSPGAVHGIYNILSHSIPPEMKNILRKQLTAEYSIDPLSDHAKNDNAYKEDYNRDLQVYERSL